MLCIVAVLLDCATEETSRLRPKSRGLCLCQDASRIGCFGVFVGVCVWFCCVMPLDDMIDRVLECFFMETPFTERWISKPFPCHGRSLVHVLLQAANGVGVGVRIACHTVFKMDVKKPEGACSRSRGLKRGSQTLFVRL